MDVIRIVPVRNDEVVNGGAEKIFLLKIIGAQS